MCWCKLFAGPGAVAQHDDWPVSRNSSSPTQVVGTAVWAAQPALPAATKLAVCGPTTPVVSEVRHPALAPKFRHLRHLPLRHRHLLRPLDRHLHSLQFPHPLLCSFPLQPALPALAPLPAALPAQAPVRLTVWEPTVLGAPAVRPAAVVCSQQHTLLPLQQLMVAGAAKQQMAT